MRRLALVAAVPLLILACKHAASSGDAAADGAVDAAVDAGHDAHRGLAFIETRRPLVPVIDFTPDASASPEERKRALASLLAGASPAGNLQEDATDPDAGFEYFQYSHLTREEVEVTHVAPGHVQLAAATVTVPITNVDRVLAGLRARFLRCYTAGLASDPAMNGMLTLTAKVLPNGEVDTVDVAQNTGLSSSVASCVSRGLRGAVFDPPVGGGGSTVKVPITFLLQK